MLVSKAFIVIFALCLVHQSVSKPTTENVLSEGRGFISSILEWITYPFYWWNSGEPQQPKTQQLVGLTTSPNDSIEIGNHNVTIWCNDQTCTTMKCDKTACRNITCNLYDTDLRGECREYNIIPDVPEEHTPPKSTEATKIPSHSEITESKSNPPQVASNIDSPLNEKENSQIKEEHPLELEAVLSSTIVNDQNIGNLPENMEDGTSPETKV